MFKKLHTDTSIREPDRLLMAARWVSIVAVVCVPISTAAANILCGILLVIWLFSGGAWRVLYRAVVQPAGTAIVFFGVWLLVGSLYANAPYQDVISRLEDWRIILLILVLMGIFSDPLWKKRLIIWYALVMGVVSLASLAFWLVDLQIREGSIRPAGILMTNYNVQSLALSAATLCALYLMTDSESGYGWRRKLLTGMVLLFAFNVYFVSDSRSGYLVFFVCFVGWLVMDRRYRGLWLWAGVFLVPLMLYFTSETLRQRVDLAITEAGAVDASEPMTSIGARLSFWSNSIELIGDAPIFGHGTGAFGEVYRSKIGERDPENINASYTTDPHNQYIMILVENGAVGLFLFLFYLMLAIKQGLSVTPIAAIFILAVSVSSFFNSCFTSFAESHLFAFFIGSLLAKGGRCESMLSLDARGNIEECHGDIVK